MSSRRALACDGLRGDRVIFGGLDSKGAPGDVTGCNSKASPFLSARLSVGVVGLPSLDRTGLVSSLSSLSTFTRVVLIRPILRHWLSSKSTSGPASLLASQINCDPSLSFIGLGASRTGLAGWVPPPKNLLLVTSPTPPGRFAAASASNARPPLPLRIAFPSTVGEAVRLTRSDRRDGPLPFTPTGRGRTGVEGLRVMNASIGPRGRGVLVRATVARGPFETRLVLPTSRRAGWYSGH